MTEDKLSYFMDVLFLNGFRIKNKLYDIVKYDLETLKEFSNKPQLEHWDVEYYRNLQLEELFK